MKNPEKVKQGKKDRAAGARFELKVRKDLESKEWIVDKWTNNVEWEVEEKAGFVTTNLKGKLVKVKPKFAYNPKIRRMVMVGNSGGFPDFIAFKFVKKEREVLSAKGTFTNHSIKETENVSRIKLFYEVIGVESKMKGILDKQEKDKCKWLLENNIFSRILIASKGEKRGEIIYKEFQNP